VHALLLFATVKRYSIKGGYANPAQKQKDEKFNQTCFHTYLKVTNKNQTEKGKFVSGIFFYTKGSLRKSEV